MGVARVFRVACIYPVLLLSLACSSVLAFSIKPEPTDQEGNIISRTSSRFGLRNWRSLGRMPGDELFNTGVLVFNAEKWHKENALRCLLQYLRDNRKFIQLCDQDAMNAVFHSTRGKLDPRWNVLQYIPLASRYSLLDKPSHEALLRNAYILHFCGPNKPWHSTRPCAYSDRFFHYLRLTAWRDWHPSKRMFNTHALSYYGRRAASLVRRFC